MSRWLLAIVVPMALITGCGFGLSGPDPQRPRTQFPKCDMGKGAVALDAVMATVASVTALALLANDEPAGALIPAGIAAIYIGGAVHGNRAVDECHAAVDDYTEMMAARDTLAKHPKLPPPQEQVGDADVDPRLPPRPQQPQQPYPEQQPQPQQPYPQQQPQPQPPYPQQQPEPEPQPQAQPQPPPQQQGPQPPRRPQRQPAPKAEDPWVDFWREVQ